MAYIIILYVSALLNGVLSIRRLLLASATRIRFMDWIIKPIMCAAASALIVRLVFAWLPFGAAVTGVNLTLKIALLIMIYTALVLITQCLRKEEIVWLKRFFRSARTRKI